MLPVESITKARRPERMANCEFGTRIFATDTCHILRAGQGSRSALATLPQACIPVRIARVRTHERRLLT
jgi:hypothetical protein